MTTEPDRQAADRIRTDLERRTSYRFAMLAAHQRRFLAEMYSEKFGLSVNAWRLMAVIGRYAPLSATEAGARTSLEPAKVTRTVDRIVEQGFVHRRRDPADRRRVILSLSAKGRGVYEQIERVLHAAEIEFLSVLRPAEIETLYALLDRLEARAAEIFTGKQAWRRIMARYDAAAAQEPASPRRAARARRQA